MFITVFPLVVTPIPLRQADIIYIIIYILYIVCYIYHILYTIFIHIFIHKFIHIFIHTSGQVDTAALCGNLRPRQDRRDAHGGKSGPLCARWGECLEKD